MKHHVMALTALLGLATAAITACATGKKADNSHIATLQPKAFIEKARADRHAVILDVRTPDEYAAGHLRGARQLDFLNTSVFEQGLGRLSKQSTYYVYCRSGKRSHAACAAMRQKGLKVVDMQGGYLNWTAQGMEVEK